MGGFGSGRRGGRDTVEDHRSIDANKLYRAGCLRSGYRGGWQWTLDGERVANISLRYESDTLNLRYRVRKNCDDWRDVEEVVNVVWQPCRFGGIRPYFICPGIVDGRRCGRRVIKLHGASIYFLCRHCYDLAYASQREDQADRASRRANKLRLNLGGELGIEAPLPKRPKGMWRRTYDRLIDEIDQLEVLADEKFALMAVRLLKLESDP